MTSLQRDRSLRFEVRQHLLLLLGGLLELLAVQHLLASLQALARGAEEREVLCVSPPDPTLQRDFVSEFKSWEVMGLYIRI